MRPKRFLSLSSSGGGLYSWDHSWNAQSPNGLVTYETAESSDFSAKSFCVLLDKECEFGQEPDSQTSCADCDEGKWSDTKSSSMCTPCEAGKSAISGDVVGVASSPELACRGW